MRSRSHLLRLPPPEILLLVMILASGEASTAHEQHGSLTGTVVKATASADPAPGAEVEIFAARWDKTYSLKSGQQGEFRQILPVDYYSITAQVADAEGFWIGVESVKVESNFEQETQISVYLNSTRTTRAPGGPRWMAVTGVQGEPRPLLVRMRLVLRRETPTPGRVRLVSTTTGALPLPGQERTAAPRTQGPFLLEGVIYGGKTPARAVVRVRDLESGKLMTESRTGADGSYSVPLVRGSVYSITSVSQGFLPQIIVLRAPLNAGEKITALSSDGTKVDPAEIRLDPDGASENLSIAARAEHETRTFSHFFSLTSPELEFYPLPGIRRIDDLALLFPGIAPAPESLGREGPSFSPAVGTAGQFSANGLRSRDNNFTVDGSDNNDEEIGVRRQGFVTPFSQSVESIQEFQVIAALPDARFGRNIGAQVNVLSKYGRSGFHGELYGFATGTPLNARNFFDLDVESFPSDLRSRIPVTADGTPDGRPVVFQLRPNIPSRIKTQDAVGFGFQDNPVGGKDSNTRTQTGLIFGGPVIPRRLFFSTSFEEQTGNGVRESHFATPAARERGIFDSGAEGIPIGGIVGKPTTIEGDAYLSFFPFPNNHLGPYGANTFTEALPHDQRGRLFSFKLDNYIGSGNNYHLLTARYNITDEKSTLPSTGSALFSSLLPEIQTQNLAAFITSVPAPSAANTVRVSFGRSIVRFRKERDPFGLPSSTSSFQGDPFLLNAPFRLNAPGFAAGFPTFLEVGPNADQLIGPVGQIVISGFSPIGADAFRFPQDRDDETFQIADTFSYVGGKHRFTTGFDLRSVRLESRVERNVRPVTVFNGLRRIAEAQLPEAEQCIRVVNCTMPGMPVPEAPSDIFSAVTLAAAGRPAAIFRTLAFDPDLRLSLKRTQTDFFFQEQWQASPQFQFTLGARIGFSRLPTEVNNRFLQGFNLEELNRQSDEVLSRTDAAGNPVCGADSRCAAFVRSLQEAFPGDFAETFASDNITADWRTGFVWSPSQARRNFILRAGWGRYTASFPAILVNESRAPFPGFVQLNLARVFAGGSEALDRLLRPDSLSVLAPNSDPDFNAVSLTAVDFEPFGSSLVLNQPGRRLQNPRSQHYSVTAESNLGGDYALSLSYVGTVGRNLLQVTTPDLGPYRSKLRYLGVLVDSGTFANQISAAIWTALPRTDNQASFLRNEPGGAITRSVFDASARSSYNSLQVQFRKAYRTGIYFNSALTYSHAIDEASDFFDMAGAFALPQNSISPSERGSANFDLRMRSVTHFVWDLPFFLNQRNNLGGWRITGIYTAQGGQPFTVNTTIDSNLDGNLTDRLHITTGLRQDPIPEDRRIKLRLDGVSPGSLIAPLGHDGSIGRNTFRGAGLYNLDLALTKRFWLPKEQHLEFRLEAFNVFNRAHFGLPVRILEFPSFGASVDTIVPARTIQFALKYVF